ncbi:DUF2785 domain-containing protein [Pseudalkalibacillus sp. Hm43]|uniref:DUF2785 domain-containing protein n=1 Tax=Pseudalkalibacillus sp. Hm43 TaxID=3450742 RepID=UPI003F4413B9
MLTEQLKELKEMTDNEIDRMDKVDLVQRMLASIGDQDPELRDHLIYTNFAKLITEQHLTTPFMADILDICMDDDHLFYRIGDKETDAVFTRSFSALVVALILNEDVKGRFLSEAKAVEACENAVRYLLEEQDLRGFEEEKGWAHAVAHGADLLAVAVQHPAVKKESFYPKALDTLKHCILRENGVYTNEEDERLLMVIHYMFQRGMDPSLLEKWVDSIWTELQDKKEHGWSNEYFHMRRNITTFLKSLYFLPALIESAPDCREKIVAYITNDLKSLYQL